MDTRRNAKESDINVGDTVLLKQIRKNKLYSRLNKTPYIVFERKGTTITAENANEHRITRNVSNFKKYINRKDHSFETESDLEDTGCRDEPIEQVDQVDEADGQERLIENDNQPRETRTRKPPERYGNSIPTYLVTTLVPKRGVMLYGHLMYIVLWLPHGTIRVVTPS